MLSDTKVPIQPKKILSNLQQNISREERDTDRQTDRQTEKSLTRKLHAFRACKKFYIHCTLLIDAQTILLSQHFQVLKKTTTTITGTKKNNNNSGNNKQTKNRRNTDPKMCFSKTVSDHSFFFLIKINHKIFLKLFILLLFETT